MKSQANQFIEASKNILAERYGEDPQASDSYCRIIGERRYDAVKSFLDNIDNSKIIVGGQTDKKDLYVAPTILYPITSNESGLMQEEIFGPILPIVPVEDMDEAIRIVNSKNTPLTIYIFTESETFREKSRFNKSCRYVHQLKLHFSVVLDNTQSGSVLVNDVLMHVQELGLPFGGLGPSGMGSYHGARSFETFSHERSTMIKTSGLESLMDARYPPYNDSKVTLFTMLTVGLPETFMGKVKACFQAIGAAHTIFFSSSNDTNDQPIKL